jgi:hypothetical protein
MITIALLFLLIVTISGLVALERAVTHARPGYEDETGFHFQAEVVQPIPVENQEQHRPRQPHTFRPAAIHDGTVGEHALTHSVGRYG